MVWFDWAWFVLTYSLLSAAYCYKVLVVVFLTVCMLGCSFTEIVEYDQVVETRIKSWESA